MILEIISDATLSRKEEASGQKPYMTINHSQQGFGVSGLIFLLSSVCPPPSEILELK